MASKFETHSHSEIKALLKANAWQERQGMRETFRRAVDIVEGRQKRHLDAELSRRYPERQALDLPIVPVPVPLAQRYVSEAANAYSHGVKRELVDDDGAVNDDATEELNNALDAIAFDKHMRRLQGFVVYLRSCGQWYQAKRGALKPTIILPSDIYPIMPEDGDFRDPTDQDDYVAFVVEISPDAQDERDADDRTFAWVSPAETVFYTGSNPFEPGSEMSAHLNPWPWPQVEEPEYNAIDPAVTELPLQPIVVWHDVEPIGGLIPENDVEIAAINLELSLQLSVLLDTIGHQGWGQMMLHSLDPHVPPAVVTAGATTAMSLGVEETAEYLTSGAPYAEIVAALKYLVQVIAISMRMSPNDFTPDAAAAASGFAKQVDSIPKIEARRERTEELARTESVYAWPRLASTLHTLGLMSGSIDELSALHLRTRFSPMPWPENAQEMATREGHELDKKLKTLAEVIADRRGITAAEAEELLADRAPEPQPEPDTGGASTPSLLGSALGGIIGRRTSA